MYTELAVAALYPGTPWRLHYINMYTHTYATVYSSITGFSEAFVCGSIVVDKGIYQREKKASVKPMARRTLVYMY